MKMKRKLLLGSTIVLLIVLTIFGSQILVLYLSKDKLSANKEDENYYNLIKSAAESNSVIALNDIFTFEWDKVFLVDPYMTAEKLTQTAGVDINALDPHMNLFRMLFLKNDIVVYDFSCNINFLKTDKLGEIILRDEAIFDSTKKNDLIILNLKN